ncbi:MAG: LysR substrate-binding domain-containing protein [Paracoccus aminovorans]|nr:LysR substrate-binding domain-containing protein [Paracoccus aminovorans]
MASKRSYRQPTLRQIEVFKAVIEAGTVSRAAELLHMSQPAASKLLSNLEADLGFDLFERRKGLLTPNDRAARFYLEVDRIFTGLNQIGRIAENLRREERGQLVIGVLPALSGRFTCAVVAEFRRAYPDVALTIHARSSQFLFDWMRGGHLDVGILTGHFEDDHVEAERILDLPLACFMPPDHPLAAQAVVAIEDIGDTPIVSFMSGGHTRLVHDRLFEAGGLVPNVSIEAATAQTLGELVAGGMGIAIMHPIYRESLGDRVVIRPLAGADLGDFKLCRMKGGRNRKLVSAFLDCVRQVSRDFEARAVAGVPQPGA